jgi:predicted SnoaL-like aldol condensation-catalyzing enzyme
MTITMTSDIERVVTMFQGFGDRDPHLATKHIHPTSYINHNPLAFDGIEGVKRFIDLLPGEKSPVKILRAFQDGAYVFTHAEGDFFGQKLFFDIFKLEEGQIVEHWDSSTEPTPPNESGHTQTGGPIEAKDLHATEKNKSIVRDFYESVVVPGNYAKIPEYFAGDHFIRHDANGGDGVAAFMARLKALAQKGIVFQIDEIKFVLGQGDFVLVAAKGSLAGESCVYYDLYRVENEKIAEHWGITENVPSQDKWNNKNGIL